MVNPGNEHTDSLIDDLNFSDLEDAPGENLLVLETPLDNQSQESSLYPYLTTEVSVMYIFIQNTHLRLDPFSPIFIKITYLVRYRCL